MNDTEIEKVNNFLNDEVMSNAVYAILLSSFLKPQTEKDVNTLAASRIAIDLLQEAWRELNANRIREEKKSTPKINHL